MRAVVLSNKGIQARIARGCVPLKVRMSYPKRGAFPLDWPAFDHWYEAYEKMDGKGFTGCAIVSHDLLAEYGHSGSAMVWELFDSAAYDAEKFNAVLDRALERAAAERKIRTAKGKSAAERTLEVATFRAKLKRSIAAEGTFQLPPRGFRPRHAMELFRLSGDAK